LLEQLQCIWGDVKDSKEIAIVEEYGNNAKRYTTALTGKTIFQSDKSHNSLVMMT